MLEFWPEYNSGPLWNDGGESVNLASLGLTDDLVERLRKWNAAYDDSKLPFENDDAAWLHEGQRLLVEVRGALDGAYEIVVTEPWWHEEPSA